MYMHTSKKSFLISFLLLVTVTFTQAQVGVGTTSPHASARFQVDANLSTQARGFLPPRLTIAERNAITSPATGLIIFNTTTNALNIYFSGAWYQLSTSVPTSSIATLVTTSPTNNGTLDAGTAATGVSSTVSYTGGNGENYSGQTVSSTGVTGLTATLSAGTFADGSGTLTYNITGTPSIAGTASFVLNIGGQTSTLNRNVDGFTTVMIGSKQWMRENLNVATYRDGTAIPEVTDPTAWANLTTGAWCWYNNDAANGAIYGKLYNWYAVADSRGLCPTGWHVPTDAELTTLSTTLGGDAVAGGKMKVAGTTRWTAPNTGADDSSGFSGLPGGFRGGAGAFTDVGSFGVWWSSTEYVTSFAWFRYLTYASGSIGRGFDNKQGGFSVRCLRD